MPKAAQTMPPAPKKARTRKIPIQAKVSQDVVEKLDQIAEKHSISRSALAAIALAKFVETGL